MTNANWSTRGIYHSCLITETGLGGEVANAILRRIQEYDKLDNQQFIKIGRPSTVFHPGGVDGHKVSYQGHVILSENEGMFIQIDFDSESKALENSAEFVYEMRTNRNILANSNKIHTNKKSDS